SSRAREALEKSAALSDDGTRSVEVLLSAAALAEREGLLEAALTDAQRALERVPTHAVALERAASLLFRLGRLGEAMAAYERAVEATSDDGLRAALLGELARLAQEAQKDPHAARSYVERSLALKPSAATLRLAAELAENDGRKEELADLLKRLAATGDREAPL